jgi:DNA-directed RNA polymerase specialized sigma24 family protein
MNLSCAIVLPLAEEMTCYSIYFDSSQMQRREDIILKGRQEHPVLFAAPFSRCHQLLYLIACRVLGGPERAQEAIENCWISASRNPPRFEYEGAFRSWLLRLLIDEALAIRGQAQETRRSTVFAERASQELQSEVSNGRNDDGTSRSVSIGV